MGTEEGTWGGQGVAALLLLLLLLHCRPLATRWCRSPNLGQLRHTGGQQHALPGGGQHCPAWGAWQSRDPQKRTVSCPCLCPPSSPSSGNVNWGWGLLPGTATPCSPPTSLWG